MKLIILDRDGVINFDSDHYIKHVNEWQPIPGSLEAIAKLSQAGYKVAVATNQSGINRGLFDIQALNAMHEALQSRVRSLGGYIDGIFFCPHRPEEACHCRKPNTGLLELIANFFQLGLNGIPFVGDTWRDIDAALKMQCQPILVCTGKGQDTLQAHRDRLEKIPVYADLSAVVAELMKDSII